MNDTRRFVVGITVFLWVFAAVVLLLRVAKNLGAGGTVDPLYLALLVAAAATVTGMLAGEKSRRLLAYTWAILGSLGVIGIALGLGLEIAGLDSLAASLAALGFGNAYLAWVADS